jgi:hypothetical protein
MLGKYYVEVFASVRIILETGIMRQLLHFILLFIFSITLFSCERKDGDWDDNIKLSTKSVEFNAMGDSVVVTTKGSWWWVANVSVDSVYYYGFMEIDLQSDSYIIERDCFVVERRDKNTLFIKVDENPLTIQRIITVAFEAGDYFDYVTITQKAK